MPVQLEPKKFKVLRGKLIRFSDAGLSESNEKDDVIVQHEPLQPRCSVTQH